MNCIKIFVALVVVFLVGCPAVGKAMTPDELQILMDGNEQITIIDVRSRSHYQQNHIPNAINIPAAVINVKRLPPLGRVIVYGDGVRTDKTLEALDALNGKAGITAEMLEGGFGGWQTITQMSTKKAGLTRAHYRPLTYQELKKISTANPDMVLVDVRSAVGTDLQAEYPLQSIIRLSQTDNGWNIRRCKREGVKNKLFVIVDDGDEEGLKVARQMRAAGIKRIALLVGGEVSLARKGATDKKTVVTRQSGSQFEQQSVEPSTE